jgi:hypothetical protein
MPTGRRHEGTGPLQTSEYMPGLQVTAAIPLQEITMPNRLLFVFVFFFKQSQVLFFF